MWYFIFGHLTWHDSYLQHSLTLILDTALCSKPCNILNKLLGLCSGSSRGLGFVLWTSSSISHPQAQKAHGVESVVPCSQSYFCCGTSIADRRYTFIHKDYFCVFCHCKLSDHINVARTIGRVKQLQVNMWRYGGTLNGINEKYCAVNLVLLLHNSSGIYMHTLLGISFSNILYRNVTRPYCYNDVISISSTKDFKLFDVYLLWMPCETLNCWNTWLTEFVHFLTQDFLLSKWNTL